MPSSPSATEAYHGEQTEAGSPLCAGQHRRPDRGQPTAGAGGGVRAARPDGSRRSTPTTAYPVSRDGSDLAWMHCLRMPREAGSMWCWPGPGSTRPFPAGPARHARRVGGGRRRAGPAPAGDRHHHSRRADVLPGNRRLRRFERAMIRSRVRAGLDRAKARGVRLGRPRTGAKVEAAIRARLAAARASRRSRRRSASGMARCRGSRWQWQA